MVMKGAHMKRTDRTAVAVVAVLLGLLAYGSAGWAAEADGLARTFTASSGLFEVAVPDGWTAVEHEDGGGVSLSSETGEIAEVTFIPSVVLQSGGVRLGAPPGAGAMAIAEGLALLLPPAEGVEVAEAALAELPSGGEAVELAATGATSEGALFILEPTEGVTALVSYTTPPGSYSAVRGSSIDWLGSLVFAGDAAGLMELLDPPPLVDILIG
jgi:hypothetical protein